ncbi:MAG: hypothetical protein ACXW3T_12055 [Rhodoplanes sp.]
MLQRVGRAGMNLIVQLETLGMIAQQHRAAKAPMIVLSGLLIDGQVRRKPVVAAGSRNFRQQDVYAAAG